MAAELERLEHTGAAVPTYITGTINAGATSCVIASSSNWPTGAVGPFVIKLDPGVTGQPSGNEEKILCSTRSGTTINFMTRGFDGTTATSHSAGGVTNLNAEHDFSAIEADDANRHLYVTTDDDHTQYSRTDGTRAITGNQTFSSGLTVTTGGATVSAGTTAVQALTASTLVASSTVTGTLLIPTGGTGATQAVRVWAATAGGPPASGTFAKGDIIPDQTGGFYTCTTAGTVGSGAVFQYTGGGVIAHGTGPAGPSPVDTTQNTSNVVYSLAANLVNGATYEVHARATGTTLTSTIEYGYATVTDSSSYIEIPTGIARYSGFIGANNASSTVLTGTYMPVCDTAQMVATATGSDTINITFGCGPGAGVVRCEPGACEITVVRIG